MPPSNKASQVIKPTHRIDVHHHVVPPAFAEAMRRKGIDKVAGAPLPKWTPQDSLDVMDRYHIETAITSLSAPGVNFDGVHQAKQLARECNEFSADMVISHPGRFGFFAVLPMPFTDSACAEAIYALDTLQADGVVLLGSTDGHFLGDERFNELMAELNQREAVVFVHPNLHATSETLGLNTPGFLLEFLCDTTRAALNLVLSGTLEQYPNIRWILAHAGGFLPYVAWRLSLANLLPGYSEQAAQGVLTYIKRFYFDTALSTSPYAMAALGELVAPSQILFGSDFPFAPAIVTGLQSEALRSMPQWDDSVRQGVDRHHALALFPHLASAEETPSPLPQYAQANAFQQAKHAGLQLLLQFVDQVRNR